MEIHSVQDYITLLEKLKELYTYDEPIAGSPTFGTQIHIPEFIYRGHGRKSYKLLPGILRTKNLSEGMQIAEYAQVEYNILNDFIAETCRFVRNIPEMIFQHGLKLHSISERRQDCLTLQKIRWWHCISHAVKQMKRMPAFGL